MPSCSNLALRSSRTAALVLAGNLCAPVALGYRTGADLPAIDTEAPVGWPASTLRFELSSQQLPPELDSDAVAAEALWSFQTWETPECAELLVEYARTTSDAAELGDGRNTVQFVSEGWADRGYASDQAGVTELDYVHLDDGEWTIAEADLFINAENYDWSIGSSDSARPLRSLLIHEGGHMLGLLHPCEDGVEDIPECSEGDFESSAMYPFYESTQLSLNEDDEAGICFLYPKCSDPSCAGAPCADDDDCEDGEECSAEGTCAIRLRELGEECGVNSVCASGLCGSDDTCVPPAGEPGAECVMSSQCISGFCNENRVCAAPPGEFGAECATSSECSSQQCLTGVEETGVCTELCDSDAVCENGWSCTPVEGRSVCAPPDLRATGGGGCSIAPTPNSASTPWLLGALLSLSFGRALRRIRKSDQVSTSKPTKSERSS